MGLVLLPHFQIIIMYALRSARWGTTYETMPCHFRASTAELAELMCRSQLNSSIELKCFKRRATVELNG